MGKMKGIKPTVSQAMPKTAPRPQAIAPRPVAAPFNRGASPVRQVAREIKREAFNQLANEQVARPRPAVRPVAPPQRIMPKQPAPAITRTPVLRPGASLIRPGVSPTRPTTLPGRVGAIRPATPPVQPPKVIQKDRPEPTPAPGLKASGKSTFQSSAPVSPTAVGTASAAALAALALNVGAAHPQISAEVSSLNYSLEDLRRRSSFSSVQEEVTNLDSTLHHALNLLESARTKGYLYQKDLDEIAYQAMDRWQGVRDQVLNSIPQQAAAFQSRLTPLGNQVARLNSVLGNPAAAMPLVGSTASQVNLLLNDLGQIERSLEANYSEIQSQCALLASRLNTVHWALGQLSEAKFRLGDGENLVMAVPARWDQVGDDDPEGILYLSNRRLIFERKEKVATKKVLFIAVAKELVHEVMIEQPLANVQEVKAVNKGLFGNQDFIEVKFSDAKLGLIPFHLNGQDSQYWVSLIQRAKSGEIEKDRSTGSGISLADLTGPLTTADLMALQSEINALQDMVTLKHVREELASIENDMRSLERTLANLRARGYAIEKSLEADVAVLATQWDRIKTNADATLESQARLLGEQMASIQKSMVELMGQAGNLNAARPLYMQIKSAIASLEAQVDAADDAVITQYDEYADEVEALAAHLDWVGWMLDALATASFQLLSTESGVAATEAIWERPGLEPENGILFLTDQRLLWEDRVGDFELKLDLPLAQVTGVQKEVDESNGVEFLVFGLGPGAPYPSARLQLALPVADAWLKMVGRARSGDYARDRAVEIDPAELERIKNAPRQCSNCGAGLTAPILRGQNQITCEYCGQVTNI